MALCRPNAGGQSHHGAGSAAGVAMPDLNGRGAPEAGVLLDVRKLVKRFGGLVAVDHVDLTIRRGEIVSVIGPNGSGKTTLFNVITGIYSPDSGQVVLD